MSLVLMGSTSGSVTLQEPAVAGSTVLDLPATSGTVGLTTSQIGMKNRIINGAMMIDQRNAGASITPTNGQYSVDRFFCYLSQSSKYSIQQNAGSVTPPVGFRNYVGVTSLSAYSVVSSDYFSIAQGVEGFNVSDLAWGTANAKTVTLSFWVRSSLTGTFGGVLSSGSRIYVYSYTINSANTWEYKTITIPGDTSGTWNTDSNAAFYLNFCIGAGSTYLGTPGSWGTTNLFGPTGQVNVTGTNGATFYITGVQLELGSAATTFDFRAYGTELALCQRYYEVLYADAAGENLFSALWGTGQRARWFFQTQKRASPSFGLTSGGSWQVATPTGLNGGINSVGFFHASSNYYLLGSANAAVAFASIEL